MRVFRGLSGRERLRRYTLSLIEEWNFGFTIPMEIVIILAWLC